MDLGTALANALAYGLGIANTKISRKYLDRVIYLRKRIYAEKNKPEKDRNFAVIDNAQNELCIIAEEVSKFGTQKPGN
jgi:hypothetical protein